MVRASTRNPGEDSWLQRPGSARVIITSEQTANRIR
jgi:hypothetical protein